MKLSGVAGDPGKHPEPSRAERLGGGRQRGLRAGSAAVLALMMAGILVLDVLTAQGVSAATLYAIPVLLSCSGTGARTPTVLAGIATLLAVVGLAWSPPGISLELAVLDQSISVAAIWIVAAVGISRESNLVRIVESDERQRVLLNELDHRVRNNLSGLLSFVDQMSREERLGEASHRALRDRIRSMLTVYAILSKSRWAPTTLRALLGELLTDEQRTAVECEGPLMPIAPRQLQAIGLVMSELVVNSTKYGALSANGGRVRMMWTIDERGDRRERWIRLRWEEAGGPRLTGEPVRPGLGTRLIEGFVTHDLRGVCRMSYPAEGCRHEFEFELDSVNEDSRRLGGRRAS